MRGEGNGVNEGQGEGARLGGDSSTGEAFSGSLEFLMFGS